MNQSELDEIQEDTMSMEEKLEALEALEIIPTDIIKLHNEIYKKYGRKNTKAKSRGGI